MKDIDMTMDMGINPYDRLIETKPEEIQIDESAVVLMDNRPTVSQPLKQNKAVEMIPLEDKTVYSEIKTRECTSQYKNEIYIEDDLLVPDTEPDMETILNIEGRVENLQLLEETSDDSSIRGEIKIEAMYKPNDSHNDRVIVIKASVPFKKDWNGPSDADIKAAIKNIEYRIINERKYRVKITLEIKARQLEYAERKLFIGIKDQELEKKTEKIKFMDILSSKIKESEISENLPLKDETVRPVKIIKTRFTAAENQRQTAGEKVICNMSVWVQILYIAEVASQGNLANNLMYFSGKIDHTEFVMTEGPAKIAGCRLDIDTSGIKAEINNDASGFHITGSIKTEAEPYNIMEFEVISDFFHKKENIVWDRVDESICTGMETENVNIQMHDNITIEHESDMPQRVLYAVGNITESNIKDGILSGKIQFEILAISRDGRTMMAKKNAEFSSTVKEHKDADIEDIFVREMEAEIVNQNQLEINTNIQAVLTRTEKCSTSFISRPCILIEEEKKKEYPLIIYTVKDSDSLWDIARRYRVPEKHITEMNGIEDVKGGMKIIIAK